MSKKAMKLALEAAYLAGFNASGEGYNGEYPFRDHARNPEEDAAWIKDRDNALRKTLAEQPAPMIRGDIRDGLVDDEPAQSSKPFDTHAAPGQSFDTHSRTPQQKLVPYEPSIDMQEQGSIASGYDLSQARAKKVYQAMIDMHDVMMEREPTDEWFRSQAGYPEQPAQRKPWVGLTDDEILYCVELENPKAIAEEVEAKLKEKNT